MEPDTTDTALDTKATRGRLAKVYAEALAAAAGDNAEAVGEELAAVVKGVLVASPAVEAYLGSPAVSKRKKQPLLESAFASASPLVRNLLGVLNQNGRLGLIRPVQAAYQGILDARAGRVRVKVRSAVPLDDAQRERLTATLAASIGKQPVLDVRTEPDLLGGLVVQIGDRVIDTSVRTRIQTIRTQLMAKGSSYVLNQN